MKGNFTGRLSLCALAAGLLFCRSMPTLAAQPTNDSLARRLIRLYQDTTAYSGADTATFLPAVRYARAGGAYVRVLEVTVSRKLSAEMLSATDTLAVDAYRRVRSKSSRALRGEDIRPVFGLLLPLVVIVSSTALVVSLFYWRN